MSGRGGWGALYRDPSESWWHGVGVQAAFISWKPKTEPFIGFFPARFECTPCVRHPARGLGLSYRDKGLLLSEDGDCFLVGSARGWEPRSGEVLGDE